MENDAVNIQNLEIAQLQAMVSRYPWFSYAREVLLRKLVSLEPECLESNYKENLIFFPRRDVVLLRCRQDAAIARKRAEEPVPVKDLLDIAVEPVGEGEDAFEIDFDQIQKEAESYASSVGSSDDVVVEIAPVEGLPTFAGDGMLGCEKQVSPATVAPAQRIVVVGGDYFSKEDFAQLDESERVPEIKLGAPADNTERETSAVGEEFAVDFESMDFVTETLAAIYADQGYYDKAIEVYAKLILLYPEKSAYFASLVNDIKSKN